MEPVRDAQPTPVEGTPPTPEALSPRELAESYLNFTQARVAKELTDAGASLKFNRNYERIPIPPKPSWIETGGLDESDWENERLADEQDEDGREEVIEGLSFKVNQLRDELGDLTYSRVRVGEGDQDLINQLASLEKQRLAKIEEKARIMRERSEGIEAEGGGAVVATIEELLELSDQGKIPYGRNGSGGWQLGSREKQGYSYDREGEHRGYSFVYKWGEGAFGNGASRIKILKSKDGYDITLEDTREGEIKTTKDSYEGEKADVLATRVSFKLDLQGAKIKGQHVSRGKPHKDSWGHITLTGYYEINDERFTPKNFEEFKGRLSTLAQDMKEVAAPKAAVA